MLRTDAVLRSRTYCLSFDLKEQLLVPGILQSEGCVDKENNEEEWPKWLLKHRFPEELVLQGARCSSNNTSQSPSPTFEVLIDNSGFITPFILTFAEVFFIQYQ